VFICVSFHLPVSGISHLVDILCYYVDVVIDSDATHGRNVVTDANFTIPLLMKNKVPDGFETDDRLDVSLRPDEVVHFQHFCLIYLYFLHRGNRKS